MSRIVYVNGAFVPEGEATISVFDRGFLFGDGVYEVTAVLDGKLVDNDAHLARLRRSLGEIRLAFPMPDDRIRAIQLELVRRNGLVEGGLYLQISRGAADRDFAFPARPQPSLVMFTQERSLIDNPAAKRGISVITVPDIRWQRRDIKTVQLLAPSMAKQAALDAGAEDAWMVQDGFVTEGTSNNAWIVKDNHVITRQLSHDILHGITRRAVIALARDGTISVEERPFGVEEALEADEAFLTSAGTFVIPVVRIDGHPIGNGSVGPVSAKLRELYIAEVRKP
jgi:D-alanine transaminase